MKPWVLPVLLMLLIAVGYHWRQELRTMLLGSGPSFHAAQTSKEEAALSFRQGALAELRSKAVLSVSLQALIREQRLKDPAFQADVRETQADEMQSWRRQWEKDEERQQRLRGQHLTEADMENGMREALLDQAWIEQQITKDIQITEAELQTAFEARREQLKIPQTYRVAHLFLSRHGSGKGDRTTEMQSLHQQLLKGTPWNVLVQKHSEDARTRSLGGDLGWMADQRLPAGFITAVQVLKPGQTSLPVSTPLGWHLIRLLERRPARLPELEEVRLELRTQLVKQKREEALERLTQDLLNRHPRTTL